MYGVLDALLGRWCGGSVLLRFSLGCNDQLLICMVQHQACFVCVCACVLSVGVGVFWSCSSPTFLPCLVFVFVVCFFVVPPMQNIKCTGVCVKKHIALLPGIEAKIKAAAERAGKAV